MGRLWEQRRNDRWEQADLGTACLQWWFSCCPVGSCRARGFWARGAGSGQPPWSSERVLTGMASGGPALHVDAVERPRTLRATHVALTVPHRGRRQWPQEACWPRSLPLSPACSRCVCGSGGGWSPEAGG